MYVQLQLFLSTLIYDVGYEVIYKNYMVKLDLK